MTRIKKAYAKLLLATLENCTAERPTLTLVTLIPSRAHLLPMRLAGTTQPFGKRLTRHMEMLFEPPLMKPGITLTSGVILALMRCKLITMHLVAHHQQLRPPRQHRP